MNGEDTFRDHLAGKHVDTRLRSRVYLYVAISALVLLFVIYRIIADEINPLFPFVGFIIGTLIGIAVSRMFHISWDEDNQKVISRLDAYGILILILYIVFEYYRRELIEYFIQGPVVLSISFSILSGIMIGRVLGIRGKILKVIDENL